LKWTLQIRFARNIPNQAVSAVWARVCRLTA
jgi:hypothetical protein